MTSLLQHAFSVASQLSEEEQNLLASRLLTELAAEDAFDQRISATAEKLQPLASLAIAEHQSGRTKELWLDQK